MPRKPSQTIIVQPSDVADVLPALAEGSAILNAEAVARAQYTDERDLINQMMGQIQMADAMSKLTTVVSLTKLAHIKETKAYRALSGKKGVSRTGDEIPDVGTWDGFCRALGTSANKVDEDLTNLKVFGEEALNQLAATGAGYRELRQFRRLPDDSKVALIEAAKTGDKESLLDLAEELIARQTKEKEVLTARAESAEADLEARSQVLAEKSAEVDSLKETVAKAKRHIKAMDPADVGEAIRQEATLQAARAEVELRAMNAAFIALAEHSDQTGVNHSEFSSGLLFQVEMVIHQLREEFQIKDRPDGDERPEWLRDMPPAADTAIAD